MSRVANTTEAKEFEVHDAGGPFGFVVASINNHKTGNCPPEKSHDMYVLEFEPLQKVDGRTKFRQWIWSGSKSYDLKMLSIACGFDPAGGFDSTEFVGKKFQAEVLHDKKGYAKIVWKTAQPITGSLDGGGGGDDENLPF